MRCGRVIAMFCCFLAMGIVQCLDAQLIRDSVPQPEKSSVELSKLVVTAGDLVHISLQLDRAPSRSSTIGGSFTKSGSNNNLPFGFAFSGICAAGQRDIQVDLKIPNTTTSGLYTLESLYVEASADPSGLPIPKGNTKIGVQPLSLRVEGLPSLSAPLLPEHSTAAILPTQKQYIKSQAFDLRDLRDALVQQLDENAADEPTTVDRLIQAISSADAMLPETERVYLSYFKSPLSDVQRPVLFQDFHRHYADALTELRAHRRQLGSTTASSEHPYSLLLAQLKDRPSNGSASEEDFRSHPLGWSYNLQQKGALELLNQNVRAYLMIADAGFDTFTIRLTSIPQGASVLYWRLGEKPKSLPKSTDIDGVLFPFAMWTFRFEKQGCSFRDFTPDPYLGGKQEVDAELVCKAGHGSR